MKWFDIKKNIAGIWVSKSKIPNNVESMKDCSLGTPKRIIPVMVLVSLTPQPPIDIGIWLTSKTIKKIKLNSIIFTLIPNEYPTVKKINIRFIWQKKDTIDAFKISFLSLKKIKNSLAIFWIFFINFFLKSNFFNKNKPTIEITENVNIGMMTNRSFEIQFGKSKFDIMLWKTINIKSDERTKYFSVTTKLIDLGIEKTILFVIKTL